MHTSTALEQTGEWTRVQRLIALARTAYDEEITPERREQMRQRVLAKLDQMAQERERRHNRRRAAARVFLAGVAALLLAGIALKLRSA